MSRQNLKHYQQNLHDHLLAAASDNHLINDWEFSLPSHTTLSYEEHVNERLSVYRNNVIYSLTQALSDQFPVCVRLVGEGFFLGLATEFVRSRPPREPALTFYGDRFPDFIQHHPRCNTLPFLADIARLEWLCQSALHAADATPITTEALANRNPEVIGNLCLELLPGTALLQSVFPIDRIWEENQKTQPDVVSLNAGHANLLVFRRDFHVQVVNLEPEAFALLQALAQNFCLTEAWKQTRKQFAIDSDQVSQMLLYLINLKIFAHIYFE